MLRISQPALFLRASPSLAARSQWKMKLYSPHQGSVKQAMKVQRANQEALQQHLQRWRKLRDYSNTSPSTPAAKFYWYIERWPRHSNGQQLRSFHTTSPHFKAKSSKHKPSKASRPAPSRSSQPISKTAASTETKANPRNTDSDASSIAADATNSEKLKAEAYQKIEVIPFSLDQQYAQTIATALAWRYLRAGAIKARQSFFSSLTLPAPKLIQIKPLLLPIWLKDTIWKAVATYATKFVSRRRLMMRVQPQGENFLCLFWTPQGGPPWNRL
jgi:hypothetical protein